MKKILLLFIFILLLTGCGKVDKDSLIDEFKDKVEGSKAYVTDSTMEIFNMEETFSYNISVAYMDDDYFKVNMTNVMNNHEQIILRNGEEVYVVTPSLNKSYRFVSEWPYNSSQSYILNCLVKDINDSSDVIYKEEGDEYILQVDVHYPNNSNLVYEKLIFNKDKELKRVDVYDSNDVIAISVKYNKIDYKANLNGDDFNVDKIVDENCCDIEEDDVETSLSDNISYPLYVPANTYLNNKEMVNTEQGERAILTFNGEKNFILIEEIAKKRDDFEIVSVYGDPTMLNNTIGALSSNSLVWTIDSIDYYLASNDLSTTELLTIADSLNVLDVVLEK